MALLNRAPTPPLEACCAPAAAEVVTGSVVVLLCAGKPEIVQSESGDPSVTTQESVGGLYLGSETRYQAAAALIGTGVRFVVVGGSQGKVDAMRLYLTQRGAPGEGEMDEVLRLVSAPDTHGNMRALRAALEDGRLARGDPAAPLVILTNAYHLPRAAFFASDVLQGIPDVRFASAENVLGLQPPPLVRSLEDVPRAPREPGREPPAVLLQMLEHERSRPSTSDDTLPARLDAEERGLRGWAAGEYRDQFVYAS